MAELIPGLPDDLARECLVRVHYSQFSTISSVCKAWKSELESQEFRLYRKQSCNTQKLIVTSCELLPRNRPLQLTFLEPETGVCSCLAPAPNLPDGWPDFFEVVSCMSSFVMVVGLALGQGQYEINVFVFDFFLSTWRRGTNTSLPGMKAVPNGCTSDGDHMVYVLCKNSAISDIKDTPIIVYDITKDEWTTLSYISIPISGFTSISYRDRTKIHVMWHEDFTEISRWRHFDVSTSQWDVSQHEFLNSLEPLRVTIKGECVVCEDNGRWYGCSENGEVLALRGSMWEVIAKLPSEVCRAKFVKVWKSKLVVVGCCQRTEWSMKYETFVLDLKNHGWTRVKQSRELRDIYTVCSMEI